MGDRPSLSFWFVVLIGISSIPVLIEFSKVQKQYEVIKRPRHRHHSRLIDSEDDSPQGRGRREKRERVKAIIESNNDYEVNQRIYSVQRITLARRYRLSCSFGQRSVSPVKSVRNFNLHQDKSTAN